MQIRSLGYRTDLALLQAGGSEISDHGDHLVVRSPHNPTHWWGNFLLLAEIPPAEAVENWLKRFAAEFPEADHCTFGFDGIAGRVGDLAGFAGRGFAVEAQTVMTAGSVHPPRRRDTTAEYRALSSDEDWAQSVELNMRCNDTFDTDYHRGYVTSKVSTQRRLVEAGLGRWFGAFADGQLRCQMGLYRAEPTLARFQSVETDPDFRRRGLAGALVFYVSRFGFDELGVRTLVMVADPDYVAIDLYRAVGFVDTESQCQAERGDHGVG
ncbi:MAG: GNAT family N-acetyltransferase [Nakamurella sp.]